MTDKDYYSILGISKEDKSLKGKDFNDKLSKQFRKLSMKWHPDKWVNGTDAEKKEAEEKFKEIAEAYSVLSDEEKRNQYDNRGSGGFNPFPNGFNPFGPGGPFSHMRGGRFGFGFDPFGNQDTYSGPPPINGSNVLIDVMITLEEAYNGTMKTVRYQREVECSHCHGTGSDDGKTHKCSHCNGTGQIANTRRNGNMTFTTLTTCPYCGGTGSEPTKKCHVCGGIGYTTKTEEKEIPVPRGVDNGTTMGYSGLGNPGKNGGQDGALEVRFTIKNDSYYKRKGIDLIHYEEVPIIDALLGSNREIKCIDGTTVPLNMKELTPDNAEIIYPDKGMPTLDRFGRNGPNGSMTVFVKYKLPNKLTKKQKEMLEALRKEWQ